MFFCCSVLAGRNLPGQAGMMGGMKMAVLVVTMIGFFTIANAYSRSGPIKIGIKILKLGLRGLLRILISVARLGITALR